MKTTIETRLTLYVKDPNNRLSLDPEGLDEDGWHECVATSLGASVTAHMVKSFRDLGVLTKLVQQDVKVTEEVIVERLIHEDT